MNGTACSTRYLWIPQRLGRRRLPPTGGPDSFYVQRPLWRQQRLLRRAQERKLNGGTAKRRSQWQFLDTRLLTPRGSSIDAGSIWIIEPQAQFSWTRRQRLIQVQRITAFRPAMSSLRFQRHATPTCLAPSWLCQDRRCRFGAMAIVRCCFPSLAFGLGSSTGAKSNGSTKQ